MKLTAKQENVLGVIRELIKNHEENPTGYALHKYLSNMGVKDSIKSVMQVVEALEKKDLIKRDKERRIYLVKNKSFANLDNIISIPLFGLASCGEALAYAESDMADDFLQISKSFFPSNKKGEVIDWGELDGSSKGNVTDDYVLEGLGYTIKTK